jgi:hypothetical protein
MSRWFMLHNGMHHRVDEGLYLHYRGTCDVHDVTEVSTARSPWGYCQMLWIRKHGWHMPVRRFRLVSRPFHQHRSSNCLETSHVRRLEIFHQL